MQDSLSVCRIDKSRKRTKSFKTAVLLSVVYIDNLFSLFLRVVRLLFLSMIEEKRPWNPPLATMASCAEFKLVSGSHGSNLALPLSVVLNKNSCKDNKRSKNRCCLFYYESPFFFYISHQVG